MVEKDGSVAMPKNNKKKDVFTKDYLELIASKKRNIVVFFIVLALICSLPFILMKGVSFGKDLMFHLSRISDVNYCLETGNVGCYIYPNYLGGYGYGSPLFYPDIFLYIPALFMYLGVSLVTSYKLFLFLTSLCAIFTMYIAVKNITNDKRAGLFSAVVYGLAAYRLICLYSRAGLGEGLAFVFAPLIIYGIYEVIYGDYKKFYILVIGMAGAILSHNLTSAIITVLLFGLCLVNIKKFLLEKKRIYYLLLSAFITVCLTGYFIFPMIEQLQNTNYSFFAEYEFFYQNFSPVWMYFIAVPNEQIGLNVSFAIIVYMYVKTFNKKEGFINFCFIASAIILLCTTRLFPWDLFPVLMKYLQFSWRLYFLVTVLLSVGAGLLYTKIKGRPKLINMIIISCIIPLISVSVMSLAEDKIGSFSGYYIGGGEYLPRYTNMRTIITEGDRVNSEHPLTMTSTKKDLHMVIYFEGNEQENELQFPLLYYKGYQVLLNGEGIPNYVLEGGLLGATIGPIEAGKIEISYRGTMTQHITKYISLTSAIFFGGYLVFIKRKNKSVVT